MNSRNSTGCHQNFSSINNLPPKINANRWAAKTNHIDSDSLPRVAQPSWCSIKCPISIKSRGFAQQVRACTNLVQVALLQQTDLLQAK